jgi:hypothetical protein
MLGNDVSPAERIQLLRSTIEDFCIADESLEDDPLYRFRLIFLLHNFVMKNRRNDYVSKINIVILFLLLFFCIEKHLRLGSIVVIL